MQKGVVARDVKAGYKDSAFHRLWECMDYSGDFMARPNAASMDPELRRDLFLY